MKRRVSGNIRMGRYLIIPVIVILVGINLDVFLISGESPDTFSVLLVPSVSLLLLTVGYLFFRYLDKAKTIEYDDRHAYISDKSGINIVPLEKIVSLKMTTSTLNGHFAWKITYTDKDDMEKSANFFPRLWNVNLEDFGQTILKENKNAKIQRFSFGPFQIDRTTG